MYSGDLRVNDENVVEVLIAADHLQVTSVIEQCCNDLHTLHCDIMYSTDILSNLHQLQIGTE